MKRKKIKEKIDKSEIAEDWCFECKDGGTLMCCDYQNCLKVYHPGCVGKDDSFLEAGGHWTCNRHSCYKCKKAPKFHCICCPNSVCKGCVKAAEFAPLNGDNGFCSSCLKLVLIIEDNVDYDSDGEKIDLEDRDTYECLFKEYWEIIKEKEGLNCEDIYSAEAQLKKGKNFKPSYHSRKNQKGEEEFELTTSDYDEDYDEVDMEHLPKSRRKGSKAREFIGWGSKALIEFLKSIGKDITKQLSQFDVDSIISKYVHENNLLHPVKKRRVICDAKLNSLFKKKWVCMTKIYNLLEEHFLENLEESEEDEVDDKDDLCSGDEHGNTMIPQKKHKTLRQDCKPQESEADVKFQESCYASIIGDNIKHVYLRRTLVEELLKQPETFEDKIVGCFVKVRIGPTDYMQMSSYRLLQVTGIKRTSEPDQMNSKFFLQVSDMPMDVCLSMLSDYAFIEEDCEELREKVKNGLHRKPTVVELEQKARSLQELIMKDWIERELVRLQNLIERTNEKGWRRELFELLEKRDCLRKPSEQAKLLQRMPKVTAELVEVKPASV